MGPRPSSPGILKTRAPELAAIQRLADSVVVFCTYWVSCQGFGVRYGRPDSLAGALAIVWGRRFGLSGRALKLRNFRRTISVFMLY